MTRRSRFDRLTRACSDRQCVPLASRADAIARHRHQPDSDRCRRHRRSGQERSRPGGRRLGDCGDHRHAHQVPEDRRHRRPGPVPVARSPGTTRHIQDLGARLWPRRFHASPRDTGPAARTHRGAGARSPRSRADLPGELLVLAHRHSAREGLSGHGPVRQRHQSRHDHATSLD